MPWCDTCSQFHAPATLEDGRCATCGDALDTEGHDHEEVTKAQTVGQSAPWHFWLVVVALAAYLLWRLVDFVAWLLT